MDKTPETQIRELEDVIKNLDEASTLIYDAGRIAEEHIQHSSRRYFLFRSFIETEMFVIQSRIKLIRVTQNLVAGG